MVDQEFNMEPEDDLPAELGAEAGRPRIRKTADAFRTISEVADELHVPQHVLRFWETKFPQVRPLKRGGGRRYYRPEDVALLRRVADLLYTQGYTIKGVQRLLRDGGGAFQENIPPASPEERAAAQQEHVAPVVRRTPVQPPMPGLLEPALAPAPVPSPVPAAVDAATLVPYSLSPAAPAPAAAPASLLPIPALPAAGSEDAARLRVLLTETLSALEALRRMLG